MAPPARRVGAGQFDQLLFDVSFDLDLVRTSRPWPGIEGRLDPLGDETLPDASDGARAYTQSRDDVLVAATLAMYGIRQQQDAP